MNICDLCQLSSPSGCTKLSNETCLKDALKLIKASATNGDVIKVIFPNECKILKDMFDFFDHTWCNTPYKEGDTDESDAEFMCRVMSKTVNKSIADNNFIGGF